MHNRVHSGNYKIVRLTSRRFERSPFQERWETPDTVMGVYAGRYYSVFNGEDVEAAYWSLRRKAVLYDVPERPVDISGPNAEQLLERVLARRIGDLEEGRGRYALACTANGGLFMDGVLFRLGEHRFWFVQPDGPLETWLNAHSDGLDVSICDPHSRVLQIQGPASPAIVKEATGGAVNEAMNYFHSGFFNVGGQDVYVSRTGWTGELGYEIYTQGGSTNCGKLWDHLMAVGERHGMICASISSMSIRRIEAGILDSGTDFDETMTPFEAGLGAFVDLQSKDFIGRGALLQADRRPRLFGLKCLGVTPGHGCTISDGKRTVGHVTAGTWSPTLQAGVGYARFHSAEDWLGQSLTLHTPAGDAEACEVVSLPFFDQQKHIPRGLSAEAP